MFNEMKNDPISEFLVSKKLFSLPALIALYPHLFSLQESPLGVTFVDIQGVAQLVASQNGVPENDTMVYAEIIPRFCLRETFLQSRMNIGGYLWLVFGTVQCHASVLDSSSGSCNSLIQMKFEIERYLRLPSSPGTATISSLCSSLGGFERNSEKRGTVEKLLAQLRKSSMEILFPEICHDHVSIFLFLFVALTVSSYVANRLYLWLSRQYVLYGILYIRFNECFYAGKGKQISAFATQ
jgi:hypothetical protein